MEWYVVNTFSGYENTVKKNLEERIEKGGLHEQFGEILIPSEKVAERRGKSTVQKTNKFFPGYIFIEMELTKASWHLVQTTPKVTGFLGGQNPRKVPTPEMNRVRGQEPIPSEQPVPEKVVPNITYTVGQQVVIAVGWIVTGLHGYLHVAFFTSHATHYTTSWLCDPRFLIGLPIYAVSLSLNIHSDAIVRGLRRRDEVALGERVYRIPRGGLYRWVSSPSYLTELTGWAGLALCTWSLAGVFIFAVSAANLVPRALSTHRWYRERFPDYPRERRALIPFVL